MLYKIAPALFVCGVGWIILLPHFCIFNRDIVYFSFELKISSFSSANGACFKALLANTMVAHLGLCTDGIGLNVLLSSSRHFVCLQWQYERCRLVWYEMKIFRKLFVYFSYIFIKFSSYDLTLDDICICYLGESRTNCPSGLRNGHIRKERGIVLIR